MSKTLDIISRLLAKADSTTPEEAEALIAKAQELATTHSIDLAVARQHTAQRMRREEPTVRNLVIGKRGEKMNVKKIHLFGAVARNNNVTYDMAHNNTYVVMYGFPSDIEMVEVLYMSLLVQMADFCAKAMKTGEYKNETVTYERKVGNSYWGEQEVEYVTKPMDGRTFRHNFYEGFTSRISERLRDARRGAEKAAVANLRETTVLNEDGEEVTVTVSDDVAMVLVSKREEVASFYTAKSNAKGSWRGANTSARSSGAREAGRAAGSNARLTGQRSLPGARGELR